MLNEQTMIMEDDPLSMQLHLDKDKMLDAMTEAIKELNDEQKQCVTLFYLDKKSYTQIAEISGYSMMQVKSYIQNGKRNLKKEVERIIKVK
jgi:RNA polymerase sigma factor (sigma-70 family)